MFLNDINEYKHKKIITSQKNKQPFFLIFARNNKIMHQSKKVLVLGASSNPERYSFKAIQMLSNHQHEVFAIGNKNDQVENVIIHKEPFDINELDTITLYLSAKNQKSYYDFIINQKPNRVIFNPGTENPELYDVLKQKNISFEEACTLVLLSTNQF